MKFVAVIFVLAFFVQDNEAWLWRRRGRRTLPSCSPRNCQVSAWSQWSSCPCGSSGTRTRTRRIIFPAACGGTCFSHRLESQFCKRDCQNSGTPTRNGCLCPPGYLGTCCEIAVPLTTKGEMQTTTATNRTPLPKLSTAKPRSRLTPPETSATVAPISTAIRTRQTTTRMEQVHPPVSTAQLPQSNATSRITPATPTTRSTAESSAISLTKAPPMHFANFLSFNNGDYNVSWIYNRETDRLHFMVEVMATGWVGFGFAPRAPTGMQGYDVAVGGVLNGMSYLQDYLTIGRRQPQVDIQQDWVLTYANEENGKTTLQFYRRRDTRDPVGDVRIQQGAPIFIIWAYHIMIDAQSGLLTFHGVRSRGFTNVLLIPAIMPTATRPTGFPPTTLQPTPFSAFGGMNATQPPSTGCGGTLNSTSGTFATPGYPFSYFNNLNCLWTLRIPTDSVLSLQFERFNTEQCCDFVELTVSTGRLARLSGSRNGFNVTVRGDRSQFLNITLTTDGSVVRRGFLARYNLIFAFPSATLQPTPSSASGVVDATSSLSSQVPTQPPFTGCGGLLNSSSGTFATPGYPFSYSNNLNCLWTLRIPTDSVLILQFERFNTEQCCDFVELTVSTGRLARLSGSRNEFNITVRGDRSQALNIRFTTDGSVVRIGFLARYTIIFVPRPTSFTPFNNVTLPNTAQPPSNSPSATLPTEVRRVLADLLISLARIILRLQGLIRGQITNEAFENFRNDTLQILQQVEMQLERPSNRHLGKRAIHELPDPEELAQIMDEIHRRLLG